MIINVILILNGWRYVMTININSSDLYNTCLSLSDIAIDILGSRRNDELAEYAVHNLYNFFMECKQKNFFNITSNTDLSTNELQLEKETKVVIQSLVIAFETVFDKFSKEKAIEFLDKTLMSMFTLDKKDQFNIIMSEQFFITWHSNMDNSLD